MRNSVRLAILVVLLFAAATLNTGASGAPATPPGPVLRLQRGVFDPLQSKPALPAGLTADDFPQAGRAQTVVQFEGPIQPAWRQALEALGVQVLDYIPDFAFLVLADDAQREALGKLAAVRYVGPWQPAYKVAVSLDQATAEAKAASQPVTLIVRTVPGSDAVAFSQTLRDLDITVLKHSPNAQWGDLWRVEMLPRQIPWLARRVEVTWIESFHERQLSNNVGRSVTRVAEVQSTYQARGTLLYGGSQIVGIADSGLDLGSTADIHADFAGRVLKIYALGRPGDGSDPDGHGTHVAGSVLGSGIRSGSNPAAHSYGNSFAGTAPEARLIFQSLEDSEGKLSGIPDDLNELFTPPYNDGARVHTNSWGGPTGGTQENPEYGGYDEQTRTADQFLWNHRDVVVLFAAGNEGTDKRVPFGVVDPDSVGSPGTAKNVITVGASESERATTLGDTWGNGWPDDFSHEPIKSDHISNNAQGMAGFSSRGPTDDGRIKPDVVAPGTNIISVRSRHPQAGTGWGVYNEHYLYMGGTSMATPLTAGAVTVIRQFWTDVMRASPSGALVKATLLNGAANMAPGQYGTGSTQEIPDARPNFVIGWGRVDLAGSLAAYPGGSIVFADNTTGLNTGDQITYRVSIPGSGVQADNAVTDASTAHMVSVIPILDTVARAAPAIANGQLIVNGGFETGDLSGWATYGDPYVTSDLRHSGAYSAVLTDGNNQVNEIGQRLTIPADTTSATLSFYANVFGNERFANDDLLIFALYDVDTSDELVRLATLDGAKDETTGWQLFNVRLSSADVAVIRGRQVDFYISGVTDLLNTTHFLVDDITFTTEGSGQPTPTPTPSPTPGPGAGRPLRVTLSWYDYPGNPAADGRLVNNLDLEVIAPDGAHYYGNNASAGSRDRVNSNESVEIGDARPGVYQVIVRAHNVPNGPQPYAVVMTGPGLTWDKSTLTKKVYLPLLRRAR